ncbi:phosphatase PAP2 family protein [Sediminibacterium soli]|uniref:phosphatase PAP2 family protein n=1 Tax=Sediminibacterium soli TaxID=2698829 RepID=UPI00137A493B|nr:phosphatase PAP2 family protein [Sediminibacterium soli]NCI46046.1 phosphatase PAP2 family protein [Sediminibacterium soli]
MVRKLSLLMGSFVVVSLIYAQDTTSRAKDSAALLSSESLSPPAIPATPPRSAAPARYDSYASPYKTSFRADGPIILGSIGLTLLGYNMIVNKAGLTATELAAKKESNVPWFDRGNVGYFNDKANDASYLPFFASFATPLVASLIDKKQRSHFFQVTSLYLETMAISGALYTLSAGAISRSRPLVYNPAAPYDRRVSNNSQRSFFAGHVSATASATFFAAQVFSDFNPDSKAKPYVWIAAAALPALVSYFRYEAGQHFLSDIILGYGIGMATGILVPKLHRSKTFRNLSLVPQAGRDYKGLALVYKL